MVKRLDSGRVGRVGPVKNSKQFEKIANKSVYENDSGIGTVSIDQFWQQTIAECELTNKLHIVLCVSMFYM